MGALYENNNFDLTARGINVSITPKGGTAFIITDFPDDLDPLTIDEADFADAKMDANGTWYRQQKPTPVSIHISLIPGSKGEKEMDKQIKTAITGNSETTFDVCVTYPTKNQGEESYTNKIFKKGWMTGCSLGYSATSQGRVRTKQYTFKFPTQVPQGA